MGKPLQASKWGQKHKGRDGRKLGATQGGGVLIQGMWYQRSNNDHLGLLCNLGMLGSLPGSMTSLKPPNHPVR